PARSVAGWARSTAATAWSHSRKVSASTRRRSGYPLLVPRDRGSARGARRVPRDGGELHLFAYGGRPVEVVAVGPADSPVDLGQEVRLGIDAGVAHDVAGRHLLVGRRLRLAIDGVVDQCPWLLSRYLLAHRSLLRFPQTRGRGATHMPLA